MKSYSFYYRDSLDLKSLFPQAYKFSLLYPDKDDNVVIEDGVMLLRRPEKFDPSRIHNIVRVYKHQYDYFKIEVTIRCWIEGEYRLEEITRFSAIKRSRLYKLACRVVNKIHPLPFNTHLLTQNSVSYYSKSSYLLKCTGSKVEKIGRIPRLLDPIYYQLLPYGKEFFFRTGNRIYQSEDQCAVWKLIYEGKRAIKDSMIWIEEERALLFMEYTPGLELSRHHLYKYYVETGETKTCMTFYTPDEHERESLIPYCRHIHVLMLDPYTGDIYVGTGDSDDESAIYRSTDNGNSFNLVGKGNQTWRTLTFMFTKEDIFWNTDSPDPQYISKKSRSQLTNTPNQTNEIVHYPLFNSASWNSFYDSDIDMYIMASSCEGALYDNKNRVLGIRLEHEVPFVYELFSDQSKKNETIYRGHQLFVLGKDNQNHYWFYDTRRNYYRQFKLGKAF